MPRKRPQPGKRPPTHRTREAGKKKRGAEAPTRAAPQRVGAAEESENAAPEADESIEPEVAEADAVIAEPEVLPPEPDEEKTLPVPVERDLARVDALQRYMAEVARHPLLTREQEHELAVKFRETQDPAIAYRLVTANLRLVVKIAHEYRRAAFNLLDLIQEGNVGLMQAVQKYDPYRGVKLSSYAAWWIRAYILRYLMY